MRVVLDTNVLVSLLVFRDPRYGAMWSAWLTGRITVIAAPAVADELMRVLAYPQFALRRDPAAALHEYRSQVQWIDMPPGAPGLPQCRDPDDQKFVELAHGAGVDALVTDDKALLRLRRKLSFAVETPAQFTRRLLTA